MDLAVIFSGRKEYTRTDPLKIRMDEGVHQVVGDHWGRIRVTCSHITFVGKGKDQTTVRGGFYVRNQQNVKFEELTISNSRLIEPPKTRRQGGKGGGWMINSRVEKEDPRFSMKLSGVGLFLGGSETNVDVLKCIVKECGQTGMTVDSGATVTATQCEFTANGTSGVYCCGYLGAQIKQIPKVRLNDCTIHHNRWYGLQAFDRAVVDVHGTKTDIHTNNYHGIWATSRAKVNIHLPSQHNTSHDNGGDDRNQEAMYQHGDPGSIANINADGTFTHDVVVEVEEDDDY
jgi:hypothetical protein